MASTNSDADWLKNGTLASPATARASKRLAGARRPDEQHALRDHAAKPLVLLRLAQEVDQLLELLLDLVDARDVSERRPRPLRVVEPRPALTKRARASRRRRRRWPPGGSSRATAITIKQRRPEAQEQRQPERRRRVLRLGVDGDAVLLEQRLEAVIGERRSLRR